VRTARGLSRRSTKARVWRCRSPGCHRGPGGRARRRGSEYAHRGSAAGDPESPTHGWRPSGRRRAGRQVHRAQLKDWRNHRRPSCRRPARFLCPPAEVSGTVAVPRGWPGRAADPEVPGQRRRAVPLVPRHDCSDRRREQHLIRPDPKVSMAHLAPPMPRRLPRHRPPPAFSAY
jgi:hypothetical protein